MIENETVARPTWVWVLSTLYIVSSLFGLYSVYRIVNGTLVVPPDYQEYLSRLSVIDHIITIVVMTANIVGAVLLFKLRKEALEFIGAALAIGALHSIWGIFHEHLLTVVSLFTILLGWVIGFFVLRYISRLTDRKVLC